MDVPHDRDDRVLLLRRADHHALVVEQRRGQPVVEQQVPRIIIALRAATRAASAMATAWSGPWVSSPG
jgi:hypothetical protein